MSSTVAKMNLRPHERRLVAIVALVLFVVLNMVFVWPHFGDWNVANIKYARALKTLDLYRQEIARVPAYKVKLRELQDQGQVVVPDEQELDLVRTINTLAQQNRLNVISADTRPRASLTTQTNRFFEEQYMNLRATTGNEELINFLVSLTSSNSLIRVKELHLKPDPGVTKLDASLTVVASYQRKTPAKVDVPLTTPVPTNLAKASAKPAPARTLSRTNKAGASPLASAQTNKAGASGKTVTPPKTVALKPRLTNQPARKP